MYYVVADGHAYAMDHSLDTPYGAPVCTDGTIDWDAAYDFDFSNGMEGMNEEEVEYVAHICYHLQQIAKLTEEYNKQEVYVK